MINDLEIVQWDYLLDPAFQLVNTAGKPLTNGWIEVYIHGTRDKYYCASDFNGTLHPFQIPLDSLGSNIVLASPANAYDVYVYNVYGSLVMSRYNVKPGSGSGSGVIPADASYGIFGTNELPFNNTTNTGFQFTAKDIGGDDITFHEITYPYGRIDCKEGVYFYSATIEVSNTTTSNESVRFQVLAGKNPNQSIYWLDFDNSYLHKQLYTVCGIANFVNDDTFRINVSPYQLTNGVKATASQVAIHKLSTVVEGEGGGGGHEYGAGWGIVINNDEIAVDPSIIPTIEYVDASVSAVSSTLISTIESVSGNLQDQIDNIPAQVQSDWNQTDDTQVDYIKNKPDLTVYATHDEVCAVSSILQNEIDNIDMSEYVTHTELNSTVTAVSSVLENEIQIVSGAIPVVTGYATKDEVNTVSSTIINTIEVVSGAIQDTIESVSGTLQEEIDNIPEQVNADWDAVSGKAEILNKPDLSVFATHDEVDNVSGAIVQYIDDSIDVVNNNVTAVSSVLNDKIDTVSGAIIHYQGASGVNVDGDTISLEDPLYIEAGEHIEFSQDGDNITISADVSDIEADIQEVSGKLDELSATVASASGIEYGQFYSTGITTTPATMARVKGTIAVDNGRIQLKKGSSYHVTVRGRYNQTTAANTNTAVGYIEYVSNNTINVNVDKTITDSQYFEISYDLYNLSNNVDYLVWFTGTDGGTVNDLWIEVHSLTGIGGQGGGTGPGTEYTPGYGIQILNNVISVSGIAPQVQSDWAQDDNTEVDFIKNKPEEQALVAGDNINIQVSGSNVIISSTSDGEVTEQELAIVSGVLNSRINTVSGAAYKQSDWTEEDNTKVEFIKNKPTEYDLIGGQNVNVTVSGTNVIIDSTASGDVTHADLEAVSGALETDIQTVSAAIPEEMSLVAGDNIEIQVSGASAIISSTATGDVTQADLEAVSGQLESDIQTVSAAIPDVSSFATEAELQIVSAAIPAELTGASGVKIEDDVASLDDPIFVKAGSGITITQDGDDIVISSTVTGSPQVNADWTAVSGAAEILNKPNEYNLIAGTNVVITKEGNDVTISARGGGGGGSSYIAGTGIDITNDVISVSGVAMASAIDVVSGKLPTTELGKFTIQNNVSGGPIEVICPTDQGFPIETVILDNNAVSGTTGSGTSSVYIVYKSPGYDDDYYSAEGSAILHIPEAVSGLAVIQLVYAPNSNPTTFGAPSFITPQYIYGDSAGGRYVLDAGDYDVNVIANQVPQSTGGYGKYIILYAAGPGPDVQALLKSSFSLAVRHPELGLTVNLDRYALGNTNTTTSTSGLSEAVIYNDPVTKKQSVYLPSFMPNNWTSRLIKSYSYGSNYNGTPSYTDQVGIAYKSTSTGYQFAILTDYDTTNRKLTFLSYNETGDAIEKWTCNYSNYGSNVWTTTPISQDMSEYATEVELQAVSGALDNYIADSDIELNGSNQVTAIDGHALATGGSSGNNYVKVITDSAQTSEVTFGDLRALCEGHAEFDLFYDATNPYRRYLYRCSHAYINSTWCQVCFSTVPITRTDELYSKTYGKQSNKVYDLEFIFWSVRDDGPSDDTIVYVSSNLIPGAVNNNFAERNIQADWNETDTLAQTYIKNKPNLSQYATQTELQAVSGAIPEEINLIPGSGITIEVSGASAVISSTGGGGGSSYTAGDFIDITNNVISVDDTSNVVAGNGINITQSGNNTTISLGVTAGISDIQLVNSLPASPTSTVLYLIPET